ncbi:pyridoxal phosphate-dependent aminotransferase, partial [Streptomyces spectabilis]
PAPGGHRFGDDIDALRERPPPGPLLGPHPVERAGALGAPEPLESPHVARALARIGSALDDLRAEAQRWEPPR